MMDRAETRILRFLARGVARPEHAAARDAVLLRAEGGTISVGQDLLGSMLRRGLVIADAEAVALSEDGRACLARSEADKDPFQTQHREIEATQLPTSHGFETVAVNVAESPLAQLMRRRDRSGQAFLARQEFAAGERLRSDYTRGQLVPRLGANWEASVASGRRDDANGIAGLTDSALASRQRVEHALRAVGPELSGLLVDVCCFLKGMETVEMERGWPVRSAKIVLKTALAALARHYWPDQGGRDRRQPVLHWGADGFKPTQLGGS